MRYSLSLIFLLIIIIPSISPAQWSSDPYENTLMAYEAFDPQMVIDSNGGAIIIYWSSAYYRLVAQRLDKYGYKCWGDSGVVLTSPGNYQASLFDLIPIENGGCAIAFCDVYGEYPYTFSRIIVQRLDSLGNELWGENGVRVSDIVEDNTGNPRIENDGYGGYFVIWHDGRYNYYEPQVYGQRLDSEGNLLWQINGINISGETNFSGIDNEIVSGGQGYALVFWHEGYQNLMGQKIDHEGNFYWGDEGSLLTEIITYSNKYHSDDESGAIISGKDFNDGLYTMRIDSQGNSVWEEEILINEMTESLWSSTHNDSGNYYIWADGIIGVTPILTQLVSQSGLLMWYPSPLLISDSVSTNGRPLNITTGDNETMNIWLNGTDDCLIAKKLYANGLNVWDNDMVDFSHIVNSISDIGMISDMDGGAIICWTVYPAFLYAQQISANGNLGEVLSAERENYDPNPSQITLFPNYPNPFNGGTIISFALPPSVKSITQIGIYNLMGQQVFRFDGLDTHPGLNRICWGGRNAEGIPVSSGLYFLKIEGCGGIYSTPIIKLK